MLLRRATPLLALALAALACQPPVPFDPVSNNPSSVDYAIFDPQPDATDQSPADIPLPNDLALQPQAIATQPAAQAEVLQSFQAQGGFPADQELPITFDFVRVNIDPGSGAITRSAPPLDLTSINPSNLIILSLSAAGVGPVAYDAPTAASYVVVPDDPTKPTGNKHGTLIIKKKPDASGLREFSAATYVAAVKGGPTGVQIAGGGNLNPRPTMYLITQGVDLTRPENQGLIPGNSRAEKAASAAQLEQLRKAYLLPFAALQGAGFATSDIVAMTAFTVTSAVHAVADPAAAAHGVSTALPFPSDFLFKPGTFQLVDALTSPSGPFKDLGPGLKTLDGFSTTALITANMSGLIDPKTVNKDTVFVYELTATGPKRLPEAAELANGLQPGFAAVSSQLVATGTSATNVVGLQPAVPVPLPSGGVYPLPPLHEGTEYEVILTNGITEPGGKPTAQATLGRLLALNNALLSGGKPTVAGLDAASAAQLEPLRLALKPALDNLATTKGITRAQVTLAYTFRTAGTVDKAHNIDNSLKSAAANLAALPYNPAFPASTAGPAGAVTLYCSPGIPTDLTGNPNCLGKTSPATAFSQYGVNATPATTGAAPVADVGYIVEAPIVIFSKLRCTAADATASPPRCVDTGAFGGGAAATPVTEITTALIAVPLPNNYAGCTPTPTAPCPLPLVIYHHGLGDGRRDMLYVANQLNKAGFVVAAIDSAKHGDRSYCSSNAQCTGGGTCTPIADMANPSEVDATGATPGLCSTDFVRDTNSCPTCDNKKSTPLSYFDPSGQGASANFVLSFNLFRTRDTFRQDIIDQSQLIRVLSPDPTCDPAAAATVPPPGGTCANSIITALTGVQIDKTRIYMLGQSLGGILSVPDAAANARVRKLALNASGSTLVDVFSNSASYFPALDALLATRQLDKETHPAEYLRFLTAAKWILDPADPENFAQYLLLTTIPGPLSGGAPPPGRAALGQLSQCDATVPTPFQANLYGLIGLGPTSGTTTLFHTTSAPSTFCPSGGQIEHGFLLDWAAPTVAQAAQDDVANFFKAGTLPPPTRP